jgi:hypothetical protein
MASNEKHIVEFNYDVRIPHVPLILFVKETTDSFQVLIP